MGSNSWSKDDLQRSLADPRLAGARSCPFCNGSRLALDSHVDCAIGPTRWRVRCSVCRACGPSHITPEAAVRYWNGEHVDLSDGSFRDYSCND